jgi:hypothetical protein
VRNKKMRREKENLVRYDENEKERSKGKRNKRRSYK